MSPEKTSETKQDSNLGERFFGDHHHTTTIREGTKEAKGEAWTAEEAEKRASEQWEKQYGKMMRMISKEKIFFKPLSLSATIYVAAIFICM